MSSDIAIYDDELNDLKDQVQECIDAMHTLKGTARAERYNRAQDKMKEVGKVFHQFNVDLRILSDPAEKSNYEKKAKAHTNAIASLKAKLNELKSARDDVDANPATGGDGKQDARKLAKNITDIQNNALASLARSEQMVADTERIGKEAAETLRNQTDQIKDVNQKLDEMETQVQRAKKELNAFVRRMMTDKIIICFTLLILIGIIVAVVMKVKSGGITGPTPTPTPTSNPKTPAPQQALRYGRYLF